MAPLQAFQPGVETALLFVQQTIEKHHGRLLFILWMLLRLPSGPLLLPPPALAGTIKIAALPFPAVEPALLRQLPQGVLGRHMHHPSSSSVKYPAGDLVTSVAAVSSSVPWREK